MTTTTTNMTTTNPTTTKETTIMTMTDPTIATHRTIASAVADYTAGALFWGEASVTVVSVFTRGTIDRIITVDHGGRPVSFTDRDGSIYDSAGIRAGVLASNRITDAVDRVLGHRD